MPIIYLLPSPPQIAALTWMGSDPRMTGVHYETSARKQGSGPDRSARLHRVLRVNLGHFYVVDNNAVVTRSFPTGSIIDGSSARLVTMRPALMRDYSHDNGLGCSLHRPPDRRAGSMKMASSHFDDSRKSSIIG